MQKSAQVLASFFGCGFSPFAPGTVGALGACIILYITGGLIEIFWWYVPFLILLSYLLGIWGIANLPYDWEDDDGRIVIDEAHGIFISMLFVPYTLKHLVIAFVLFRFFDILKPLGIRNLDRLKSNHGVMLDDSLAGVYSNVCLQILILCQIV